MAFSISKHWEVEPKGNQGTIGLRADLSWFQRKMQIWFKRTSVKQLYRDVQAWLGSAAGMPYSDAMWHGNFKATEKIKKKVDTVIQLKDGWSIRPDSLRALTRGPLLNPDGTEILVPAHGLLTAVVLWIEDRPIYRLLLIISAVIGLGKLLMDLVGK